MQDIINHFMWGYQQHFRINQESACKSIFPLLDERFTPQVFLVGILAQEMEKRFQACVEPELDFWADSNDFNTVLDLAYEIRKKYPEQKMIHSDPSVQKWNNDNLLRRSVSDAIQQIIKENPSKPPGYVYFVAYPTKVEGYWVSVVLGLQKAIIEKHPALNSGSVRLHACRNISVPISLIDAVVKAYLNKASGELRLPEPGSGMSEMNAEEILRDGASQLMGGLAYRADPKGLGGWHGFLTSCNNVARTFYEGAEGTGTVILARGDHPSLEKIIQFRNSPKFSIKRAARKLLQLASHQLALHTNSRNLFGLVKIMQYDAACENLFTVRFIGHHHWHVLHNAQILMGVRYEQPYLPRPAFDQEKLEKDLPRIFGKMTKKQIDRIIALVREAEQEPHGTMLMICSAAKKESERLAADGTCISPKTLTPQLLRSLTPIDGALLLNPKGTCYAIGVILDGKSTKYGDSARGARYNSAIRYVHSIKKSPALAVIVSEDGGVEFYPDLLPMIKRSEIDKAILKLQGILKAKSVNRRCYNEIMDWFYEHSFYLLAEHCEKINKYMEKIEKKIEIEEPSTLKIVRSQFVPNEGFDIDLYYETE